ncbi:hypothetical protein HDU76_010973 [Blyttiomyces sp. JEL0837]|nr:hypothetical protein HDU76_010973 [Blyttiomyces sp. JEL0837]
MEDITYEDDTARITESLNKVNAVISNPNRLPNDLARDQIRLPLRLIPFLDIKRNMRILDFSAWDGYWSTLFVPLTDLPVWCQNVIVWKDWAEPNIQRRLALTDKSQNPNGTNPYGPLRFYYSEYSDPTPPTPPMCNDPKCTGCRSDWTGWDAMFDLIFTYANYHDPRAELTGTETPSFLSSVSRLLKPGGHLIVIDHAAIDGTGTSSTKELHRIDEVVVVDEVTRIAGLEFVGSENCLRDFEDSRLGPAWVQDRNVVKTDRFCLKFRKLGGIDQERDALKSYGGA